MASDDCDCIILFFGYVHRPSVFFLRCPSLHIWGTQETDCSAKQERAVAENLFWFRHVSRRYEVTRPASQFFGSSTELRTICQCMNVVMSLADTEGQLRPKSETAFCYYQEYKCTMYLQCIPCLRSHNLLRSNVVWPPRSPSVDLRRGARIGASALRKRFEPSSSPWRWERRMRGHFSPVWMRTATTSSVSWLREPVLAVHNVEG